MRHERIYCLNTGSLSDGQALGDLPRVDPSFSCPPGSGCVCSGIVRGFSVATIGEARGWNLWADSEFLDQVMAAGNAADQKSCFTHNLSIVVTPLGTLMVVGDQLGNELGRATNFRRTDKAVYADLHIFKSADGSPRNPGMGSWVMQKAESEATMLASSIVFADDWEAEDAFIAKHLDKKGVFKSPDAGNTKNLPHCRLRALDGVDIVSSGALNPEGLFGTANDFEEVLSFALGVSQEVPESIRNIAAPVREAVRSFMTTRHLSVGSVAATQLASTEASTALAGGSLTATCPKCGTTIAEAATSDGYLSVTCRNCGSYITVSSSPPWSDDEAERRIQIAAQSLQSEITAEATKLIEQGEAATIEAAKALASTKVLLARRMQAGGTQGLGPISYERVHPTQPAISEAVWDSATMLESAQIQDLQQMAAWQQDRPRSEASRNGDFRLLHHDAVTFALNKHGLLAAMVYEPLCPFTDTDRSGVQKHLAAHCRDIGSTAPWERNPANWTAYGNLLKTLQANGQLVGWTEGSAKIPDCVADALRLTGFVAEANTLAPKPVVVPPIEAPAATLGDFKKLFAENLPHVVNGTIAREDARRRGRLD
jgi:uncharacterized Zn finger protein (UPF0148 family)